MLHRFYNNVDGSVSAFQKMRDAAEDISDFNQEIEAYYQAGLTLKRCRSYEIALKSFKRMLQVSWSYGVISQETKAYELIGLMYYYLGNVEKA